MKLALMPVPWAFLVFGSLSRGDLLGCGLSIFWVVVGAKIWSKLP